jgi:HAE1 family hydrophobic/amphiphilic exporter-1
MAKFFINRPIVAMVISIIIVLVGFVSLKSLPVAQFPEIVPPMIQVSATYPGANAVDIEQSVATPIEQQVNGVENMIYMRSINANDGTMTLEVSFEVGSDLNMSNVLVQNRVSQAMTSLPSDVTRLGVPVKKSLSFPLLIVSLKSPKGTYDNNFLSNYAAININDALSRIQGVGQLTLFGGSDYSMRVWLKPDRLSKLGVTVDDIVRAIQEQNTLSPGGQIGGAPAARGQEFTYSVQLKGRLKTPEEFGEIIVRSNPDGSQIRLKDVSRIELGTQLYNSVGRLDGKPSAVIAVYQTPGSNALKVSGEIRKKLADFSKKFPQDIEYTVSLDTTLAVSAGIEEIVHTLFEAILLVILVVFIFLQNWRATLIPLLTVPVSLLGTFIVFPMLGFSVNTLSLLGLVLAIGIVVDDAIVVVEAVIHHIERGLTPKEATLKAMEEVTGPVIAIALVLSAVFIPVAFMGGITGRLYQQFAITIAISVLFSAFNALTLSPALSALLLKPAGQPKGIAGKFFGLFNRGFEKVTGKYLGLAEILIRKLVRAAIFILVLCALIFFLGKKIPGGFVPDEDQGYLFANVQLPDASSLERTDLISKKVEKILRETPGISGFNTVTGFSLLTQAFASNTAFFFISLNPWEARRSGDLHAFGIIEKLNRRFEQEIPGAAVFAFAPPSIPGLGTGSGFSMMLQDRSGNPPEYLARYVQAFLEAAEKRPEIERVFSPYRANVPQIYADVDREKVLKLGVSLRDVNTAIGTFLGSAYINDFNRFGRLYKVYIEAESDYRKDIGNLASFYVRNDKGEMVPLSTCVTLKNTSGPEFTNRFNLYRTAEISGTPKPGYSSAQALKALEETAGKVLPADMDYDWSNVSYQEKKAAGTGGMVFVLALVFVFLILAAQYESWSLPFSVLLGTPFAVFGAFLGLWLCRYDNNVFAQIGLVMLIGLAAKNAILIVEFAREKHLRENKPLLEAALMAAKLRFRPILMTAFAFILGVVPLVVARGAAAESRKIMGMTVFAGMIAATVLGVLLVPALFVFIEKIASKKLPEKPSDV